MTLAAVVQRLTRGTEIAILFRLIRETLGSKIGTTLSVDTVPGSHVRGDVTIRQPLQELSVPVGRVRRHRFRRPANKAGCGGA